MLRSGGSSTTSSARRRRSARGGCPMRWRNGLLTASSALLLAGCGGSEHRRRRRRVRRASRRTSPRSSRPRPTGSPRSRPGRCEARDAAARFRNDVIASIGRVPARYQEPLTSAANTLAERLATCVEPKPPKQRTSPRPRAPPREEARRAMSETLVQGGRYRLERPLGHGGMATVYLAHDEELHRPVAIKLLAEHLAGDAAFRTRFLREARLAARLSHPNVVSVYDAGEAEDGRPFIVMEYVPGTTFAELGQIAPGEAVELAIQACRGLAHAHAAGLVHRDVKPQNLLLREDGTVKVADFGIARAAETDRAHPGRHGARHGGLPLAGAGARRGGDGGRGRLLARRRALRAADRAAAVRVRLARRPRGQADARARSRRSASSRRACRTASRTPSCARSHATPPTGPPRRPRFARELGAEDEPTVPLPHPGKGPAPELALARRGGTADRGRGRARSRARHRVAAPPRRRSRGRPSSSRSRAGRTPSSRRRRSRRGCGLELLGRSRLRRCPKETPSRTSAICTSSRAL